VIDGENGRFVVRTPMTTRNAAALLAEGRRLFSQPDVLVDVSNVPDIDSSGLSLLLRWSAWVQAEGRQLHFVKLDKRLESLAQLYGVTELIPRASA
jgi:phospholipid transport system transporter-binding protein